MANLRVIGLMLTLLLSCAAPTVTSTVSHPGDQPTRPSEPMAPSLQEQPVVAVPIQTPPPPNPRLKPISSAGYLSNQ
ncbi:MAG: hypothetical protein PHC70_01140 [Patescibacteria group bacterium]|nr:hypothetical protein [Patescibacteria group bacterium]